MMVKATQVLSRMEILESRGWTRRFVADEPRLSEAVEMYEASGHEVHLEPVPPKDKTGDLAMLGTHCTICFDGNEGRFKIIFTRPKKPSNGGQSHGNQTG